MHAGSNPAARTSQSQSPRFPYRGAGRLFCTRFAGSMAFRQCQIMTSGSSLPIPPRLSNRDIRLLHYQSPRRPYRFPAPPHRRILFDSPCHVSIQPDGTRCRRIPHYVVPFPIGGKTRSRPAPRFPIRPIGFSLPSSPRFPPSGSVSPFFRADGQGGCVFSAHISVFTVAFVATCDTLNRYTCGRGGTADTPDLGSGGEIRVGSNPTARTMTTHSPPLQPVQVAAGAGFFHAAKTKIQSIWHRHGRNGRAVSCT